MQTIVLGGGCFWCTEAVFLSIKGVISVVSGYMGGTAQTANYQAVCTGDSAHVEVIKITFDEKLIDLSTLLDIFFATHDPTTPNRQGNDIGTQYSSIIFYTDDQLPIIHQKISELQATGLAIVTRVEPIQNFYPAEDYHQNFYARNPTQSYCNFAIPPKLTKLKTKFASKLK